jgi:large subunit ribosomal protein L4
MAEIDIRDKDNKKIDTLGLREDIFGLPAKGHILHESVVNYLANQRQGTHSTKTRGMVRGGGKKPWKQKHTGRARAGSSRSPLWRGGAIIFGPQPRDYSYHMNKKQKRLALKTALSSKVAENQLIVIDSLPLTEPKTKVMVSLLNTLGISGKSVLVVTKEKDDNVLLSSRNIPYIGVKTAADLNTYSVLEHEYLLVTKDALISMQEGAK